MKKIAIHSVPRSGSTWLGEIINSSPVVKYCFQPLFSYQFKNFLNETSEKQEIDKFFMLLGKSDDEFISQKLNRELGTLPNFRKFPKFTHIVYKEVHHHHIIENLLQKDSEIKLILLVRDPIEVMNSWINAPKEFDPNWDINEQLISGKLKNLEKKENFYGLEAWTKTTKNFEELSKNYKERVFLINYAKLKSSLNLTAKQLFNFCNLEFTDFTQNFLTESTKKILDDNYSVYKGGNKSMIVLSKQTIEIIIKYVNDSGLSHYINKLN